jgi:hypothetical protein
MSMTNEQSNTAQLQMRARAPVSCARRSMVAPVTVYARVGHGPAKDSAGGGFAARPKDTYLVDAARSSALSPHREDTEWTVRAR